MRTISARRSTLALGWAALLALAGCGTVVAEPITPRGDTPSTLGDGLVGYWKLDESTAGEPVVDSSGSGNDGAPFNDPASSPFVAPVKIRNVASRQFNGVDQNIDLGNPDSLNFAGPITLAAWINTASMPDNCKTILSHGYRNTPSAEISLRAGHGVCDPAMSEPAWQVGMFDGEDHFAEVPISADDIGTWIHLLGTFDGQTWRLYKAGVEVATLQTDKGPTSFDAGWGIGGRVVTTPPAPRVFDGRIDEVRFYNRALTPAEIVALYNL